jgi:hypothetical protein
MGAGTAVGTVRTYARLEEGQTFNYAAWMDAVRRGQTFVTYGPLMDLAVEGQPMGGRLALPRGGGTLDVVWQAASVGMPMTRVELIVNGEVRESRTVDSRQAGGTFSLRLERSSWLALLVRGCYPGRPEVISVHSSAVMAEVADSALMAAADAVSILEQIEGALAYIDTIGTRAEDRVYRRMRMALVSAQRRLHNRMHRMGHYHEHSPGAAPEGHSHD